MMKAREAVMSVHRGLVIAMSLMAAAFPAARAHTPTAECTTAGRVTEAYVPLEYHASSMPRPAAEAPRFSREPQAPHADAVSGGIVVESVEPGRDVGMGGEDTLCFMQRVYIVSKEGKRLTVHEYALPAPLGMGSVRSRHYVYQTTRPWTFVIDGKVLIFEPYQTSCRSIRALREGSLSPEGEVQDLRLVYQAPTDLGRVVYIGDSITQGVGAPSYRWALHKILVDNGVSYEEMGVEQGNRLPEAGVTPGTLYRGRPFLNRHCAMSGERAAELSGRRHSPERLDGTSLPDWLGQTAYTGPRRLPAAPDTAIILAGTNDLLGDLGEDLDNPQKLAEAKAALLDDEQGDMSRIAAALRRANPQVRIVVIEVPTWAYFKRNNRSSAFAALADYNEALQSWAAHKGALFVPVNHILADAAAPVMGKLRQAPGRGVRAFYCEEPNMLLHPSRQGDLLIAGMVARALGLPGRLAPVRSAAAERGAALQLPATPPTAGEPLSLDLPVCEATIDTRLSAHTKDGIILNLTDSRHPARLRIHPHGITWGKGTPLLSADMTRCPIHLTLYRQAADSALSIPEGYYIWLDDLLIGEALPSQPESE